MAKRPFVFGKIPTGPALGALVGLLLFKGKWIGAAIGAIGGYLLEQRMRGSPSPKRSERPSAPPQPQTMQNAPHHVRLLAAVARMAGGYDAKARAAARTCFAVDSKLDAAGLTAIDALLDKANARKDDTPREAAKAWLAALKLDRKARTHALFTCFRVALAHGDLGGARERALRDAAIGLELDDTTFADLRGEFVAAMGGRASIDDYRVLELAPDASQEAVRERYRDAVKTYHPDRFQHLGKEFAEVAAEKFKAIQSAYERIIEALESGGNRERVLASRCPNCRKFTAAQDERCIRCDTRKLEKRAGETIIRCAFCGHPNSLRRSPPDMIQSCPICRVLLVR